MMAADKIRPAAIKIGIRLERGQRFGFHNFHHSLATFLIKKGKDVKTIQGLLRHAKASITLNIYSQAIDASKLAAQRDIALAITSNQVEATNALIERAQSSMLSSTPRQNARPIKH
jgi:integrase